MIFIYDTHSEHTPVFRFERLTSNTFRFVGDVSLNGQIVDST